ncbi:MFS transporter [Nocardiopsis sp. NRRL B-16309]|uniref:MFS transporter n=1 Tax=Nocardiopsis sp. NRRL B-16309 TaxID=1519494 RepID=UPI0006B044F1|nr:MFS transporter [Nocardiopsis sp. NRRL B-16309]KOX16995.1 major facilitator transporter [Nocardiopsis sp. NRRL B-16309]
MTGTTPAPPPVLSTRRRWTVLAICASAMFLVGLDTTIVTIGLPAIGDGLDVAVHDLAWVVDAYTVVFASLLITSGALADRFGRRRVFMTGLAVFGLASLVCAGAPSLDVLVAARAAQGVGASMLGPVALAIVVNAMPGPRERAQAIGVWASVFGLSMAAGPAAGGALIAALDWRAVFWINVPVVLVALVLVALLVPESRGARVRRLDLPGQLVLVVLLGTGIAVLIEGPVHGWASPAALAGYGVVVASAALFTWYESRRREPLIDPGLFRVPSFTGAVLGAVAVFVALSMTLLMTTFYWQGVRGWTPLAAGVATLPLAVGATVCAPLSGFLVGRVGARPPLVAAGASLLAGGAVLFGLADGSGGLLPLLGAYLLVGVGVGFANAPITDTAVSGLPPERAGVAGGTASTARQVGTAVGVALAGSLVAGAGPAEFAAASRPGWSVVALCGAALLLTAWTARASRASRSGA